MKTTSETTKSTPLRALGAATIAALLLANTAQAEEFSTTTLTVTRTNKSKPDAVFGYGTTDEKLSHVLFEHFGGTTWGTVYFDAEAAIGRSVGTPVSTGSNMQTLVILNPTISFSKVTGQKIKLGPISDVSLIARWEGSSYADAKRFHSQNYGIDLNFDVPGFAWVESGLLWRDSNYDAKKQWMWRTVLVSNPIPLGGQTFHFNLLSVLSGTDGNGTTVFVRPEFLWAVGGNSDYQLGFRYEHVNYKNDPFAGGAKYTRNTPELMFKFKF